MAVDGPGRYDRPGPPFGRCPRYRVSPRMVSISAACGGATSPLRSGSPSHSWSRVPTSSPRAVSPLRSCSRIGRSSARDMCCRRGPVRRTITAASAHSRPGGNFTAGSRAARSFPSRWSPCRALWRSRPGPKAAAGLARRNQAVLLRQDLRLLALSEPDRRTDLNARHQYREADMGLVKGGGETGAPFSARPASSAMRA
jgi:hypothetical protein